MRRDPIFYSFPDETTRFVRVPDYIALAQQVSTLTAENERLKASLDEGERAWEELAPMFRSGLVDNTLINAGGFTRFSEADNPLAYEQLRKAKERSKKNEG